MNRHIDNIELIKENVQPLKGGRKALLDLLLKLSVKDGKTLEKSIEKRGKKLEITYSIKNAKCQHCGDTLEDIPIDLERLLFTRINRESEA